MTSNGSAFCYTVRMKLISFNVNGLRAVHKKGALAKLFALSPDVLALQEIKCEVTQIPQDRFAPLGYSTYFLSAQNRKGYSGVAFYTKEKVIDVHYGLAEHSDPSHVHTEQKEELFDNEGRLITLILEKIIVMNCYFPNGGKGHDHFLYKLQYYKAFFARAKAYETIKPVVFCGDINATVADIDLARPKENAGKLGCTPEERACLSLFTHHFVDTFRFIHGDTIKYSWWDMKTRSREKNVGWRIDYFFVSQLLKKNIKDADILDSFMGSDHAPVELILSL